MQVTFEGKKGKDARSKKKKKAVAGSRGVGGRICQLGLVQDKAGPMLCKELVMGSSILKSFWGPVLGQSLTLLLQ